jgi:hypothetical protein
VGVVALEKTRIAALLLSTRFFLNFYWVGRHQHQSPVDNFVENQAGHYGTPSLMLTTMSSLPPPVTAISVDHPRRGSIIGGLRAQWARFRQNRNSGSSPSTFDKEFPVGSTEASTSVTGPADEGLRKREVYYAIPLHKGSHFRDGDDSLHKPKGQRKRTLRPGAKVNDATDHDPDEYGDVDEVVVDNSFEIGGQQESLTEPSAGPGITENQPVVAMQTGQGKIKGGAFGWDPKDKTNGLQMSSSQLRIFH